MQKLTGSIPARDGVSLAFDAWLPDGASAADPVPAVVTRTPYNRWRYHDEGSVWTRLVEAGYAHVGVDVRGCGDSSGDFVPFVHDGHDGYDVVEGVAAQEWCTGKVGMIGLSYDAITQWWTARHQPPSLRCAIPMAVSPQLLGDGGSLAYSRGVPLTYWVWWFALLQGGSVRGTVQLDWDELLSLPADAIAGPAGLDEAWQRHWQDYVGGRLGYGTSQWSVDPATIEIPMLVSSGLWDDPQTFEWWEQLVAASPAQHRLLAGMWDHAGNVAPRPVLGGIDVSAGILDPVPLWIEFLDTHLKDTPRSVVPPTVRIARTGSQTWESHDAWPLPSASERHSVGSDVWQHDPSRPLSLGVSGDLGMADAPLAASLLDRRPDVVSFDLPVAATATDYSGQPTVTLTVAQEHPGTVVCWLSDIGPEGEGMRMALWPSPHAHPGAGERVLDVVLPHLHHRLKDGHHWRLSVGSSFAPMYAHSLVSQEVHLVGGSIALPRELPG